MGKGKGKKNRGKNQQIVSSPVNPLENQPSPDQSQTQTENLDARKKEEFPQLSSTHRRTSEKKSDVKEEYAASTSYTEESEEWKQVGIKTSRKGKSLSSLSEEKKVADFERKSMQQKQIPASSSQTVRRSHYEKKIPHQAQASHEASTSYLEESEEWQQSALKTSKKGKSTEEKKLAESERKTVQQTPQRKIVHQETVHTPHYVKHSKAPERKPNQTQRSQEQEKITAADDKQGTIAKIDLPQTKLRVGGTKGKKITVITNFFPLDISKVKKACHYDVTITPDKSKKVLRIVMNEFQKTYYPTRHPCFDGKKNLYTSRPFDFPGGELSREISIKEDTRVTNFKVTIKFVTEVDIPRLNNIGSFETAKQMQAALQCLDVLFRNAVPSYFIPCGRSFFTPPQNEQAADIGGGMELYTGFFQSAVLGARPFLNIDVAHRAFPSAKNIVDLLKVMFRNINLQSELNFYQMSELNNFLKGLKVQYELPRASLKKIYTVSEVVQAAAFKTFTVDGKTQTVQEYFKTRRNVSLRYPNLPCLWVGSRERHIYIPCEFCTILPRQPVRNDKLSANQTTQIIRKVTTNTGERKERILSSLQKIDYNNNEGVREFQLSVSDKPQEVVARVLEPPTLGYDKSIPKIFEGKWKPGKFQAGVELQDWSILYLDSHLSYEDVINLSKQMIRFGSQIGMSIKPCKDVEFIAPGKTIVKDLKTYFQKRKNNLIFVVIPFAPKNIYNCVKKVSELGVGCLTQCIKTDTLTRRLNDSTVTNILLKVNAKLNGVNHTLLSAPKCLKKYAMLMGADVTHPGPNSEKPSVAAVTASCDEISFKYRVRWGLQPAKEEIIKNLQVFTEELIRAYCNGKNLPEQIIYIRDGVSDGQFKDVMEKEFAAIKAACFCINSNYKPPVTVFIVQKRHHTRFFPKDVHDAQGKYDNVPAGTCVDTVITNPIDQDFYLVSHASVQGVSRPTKYRTLCDESNMSDDDIEGLMYYLCHMYARCCRSVSYPAPTYYAHHAAARGKVYADEVNDCNNLAREQERLQIQDCIIKGRPMFFI